MPEPLPAQTNQIAKQVLDAAFKVHTFLGPGLLESVYEACMAYELRKVGIECKTQVPQPVIYENLKMELGFRVDMVVADRVIVEIKSVEILLPVHEAQLITYLRLTGKRLGLLINFNVPMLKDGIRRRVL